MAAPQPWETDAREAFRVKFDEDPDSYDRTRPVAPAIVFDDLVDLAGLERGSAVVEVGPGTGQATRPLAERGLRVVALEIGPGLADRARRNLAGFPDVEVVTTSFESWEPGSARFDAVFACNSFHWVDPALRFRKSADVLRPDGHLVVLSMPWVVPDGADRFWRDVQEDWVAVGSERLDPATQHPDRVEDIGPLVRASGFFEEPVVRRYRFDFALTAEEYATNLSTQSGVKELGPEAGAELVRRVRRRIEERGGTVTVHVLAVIVVARSRGSGERRRA